VTSEGHAAGALLKDANGLRRELQTALIEERADKAQGNICGHLACRAAWPVADKRTYGANTSGQKSDSTAPSAENCL